MPEDQMLELGSTRQDRYQATWITRCWSLAASCVQFFSLCNTRCACWLR